MQILRHITDWWLSRREQVFCRRLVRDRSAPALVRLLDFARSHDRPLPLDEAALVKAIHGRKPWTLEGTPRGFFLGELERHILSERRVVTALHWNMLARFPDSLQRRLEQDDPGLLSALAEAGRTGLFAQLSEEARHSLLGLFEQHLCSQLERPELEPSHAWTLLADLASLAHVAPSARTRQVLEQWRLRSRVRPRALTSLSDEQALQAPLRGVGSPHGVSVTLYRPAGARHATRITTAGVTGDPLLNAQIFAATFALALACDAEPTFITSNGSTLSIAAQALGLRRDRPLLAAQIGPGGPIEPQPGVPSLGLQVEDAMLIATELFKTMQADTGLVNLMHWDVSNAESLERQVRDRLRVKDGPTLRLRSDPRSSERASVVHAMPLLERTVAGDVRAVSITLPYAVVGGPGVLALLRAARSVYLRSLSSEGRRRQQVARQAAEQQARAIERWKALDARQQDDECRRTPTLRVAHQYEFELGVVVAPPKPRAVPRREYEEARRPAILKMARSYEKTFDVIAKRLDALDEDGGRADVVVFKWLVDSMIRETPLPISVPGFQDAYQAWVRVAHAPAWAALEAWALERAYPVKALAEPNVVFNARLEPERGNIVLEPWVLVDLHDFVMTIEPATGTLRVTSAGHAPSLARAIVANPDGTRPDARELHARLCEFARQQVSVRGLDELMRPGVFEKLNTSPKVAAYLAVTRAWVLLHRGQVDVARALLASVRASDRPAVYFLGTIAHAYGRPRAGPGGGTRLPGTALEKALAEVALAATAGSDTALSSEAQRYLQQLQGRAPAFVKRMLARRVPLDDTILERLLESFGLTTKEHETVRAMQSAWSCFELLALGEFIDDRAGLIPFDGMLTSDLRASVASILERANALTFGQPAVADLQWLASIAYSGAS